MNFSSPRGVGGGLAAVVGLTTTTTTHHLWLSLFFFLDKTLRIIAVEIAVHLLLPFYSLHLDQSLSTHLGHLPAYYVWGDFTKIHDCSRHQRCVPLHFGLSPCHLQKCNHRSLRNPFDHPIIFRFSISTNLILLLAL